MKRILSILCVAVLVVSLAACGASAPESESTPPPPESMSDPEPKDVSHYYVEETHDGIEDTEAVKELYWYLWENLGPREYGHINIGGTWGAETGSRDYIVLFAPDKAPVDALLQSYDGAWAPIIFYQDDRTFYDVKRAESDMRDFLSSHLDIYDISFEIVDTHIFLEVEEITDELTAFVDNYPVKGIYDVMKYFEGIPD